MVSLNPEIVEVPETLPALSRREISSDLPADAYEKFLRFADVAPKSVETYTRNLRQFFYFLEESRISNPTRETVLSYRETLQERGLKPTSVSAYLAVVKVFFEWCEQEGIYSNVARKVKAPKVSREHKKDHLTAGQLRAIAATFDRETLAGARDYAAFLLMAVCGLRTIEVSRADVSDLRPVGDKTALFIQGKGRTEKAEFVIVPAPVEAALRNYLAKRGKCESASPLFVSTSNNNAGARISAQSVSYIGKNAMRAAGFDSERLTSHSLRHSAITAALLAGKQLDEVQQFARHSKLETTMIYNHRLDRARNSCSDAVANAFFNN